MVTLLDGLSLGAIYALIALGYTMVYGIAKMLNFAHGDVIMVGAYAIFTVFSITGNPVIAFIVSIILCVVLGIVIEKLAYKPLRTASPLAVLITAIGVSNLLQGLAQLIFGTEPKSVIILNKLGSVEIADGIILNISTIVTLVLSAIIMIVLTLFIKKTKTGRAMLAVSEDKGAAQLMGVNVNKIIMITFAIGSALAAFASLFYLIKIPVSPSFGALPGIKAFAAAVIGGIGSIPGAMVGGILLGLVENICLSIDVIAPYTTSIEFGLLILILLVKPTGILGKKIREKV
ncbi:MAG: branched-chain amino acid ABC transporter permease [Clostridia bacterium]|nr:branched-chain amino acid ABC transporter permease [Clostridia bacterium]